MEDKKFEIYAVLYRIHGIMYRDNVHAYSEVNARAQFEEIHRHGKHEIVMCCPAWELSNEKAETLTALEKEKVIACISYQIFRFNDILDELDKIQDRPLTDEEGDEMHKTVIAKAFYEELVKKIRGLGEK